MEKLIIILLALTGTIFSFQTSQAQKRTGLAERPAPRFSSRIKDTKKTAPAGLDSAQFRYPNAYGVAKYYSNFYISYASFQPFYIIDGAKPDTRVEYELYDVTGKRIADYVSGDNYMPTDPYNRHPIGTEIPVHGGHKVLEFMTQLCTLKISILPVQEDTVKFSYFRLQFKYAQQYYPADYNIETGKYNGAEYSNVAGNFFTIWHQDGRDMVLTKERPTVTLHFQYNRNLVATYAGGNNTVFMPVY